jgi:hypothetical protein
MQHSESGGGAMFRRNFLAILSVWVACAAICLSANGLVFAQSSGPQKNQFGSSVRNRSTVSPYLSVIDNTGNGGNALNYYNIVKPRERARQANREIQNELHQVESGMQSSRRQGLSSNDSIPITTGRMSPTGHMTSFANTGGYFGNQGGGGGGRGGGGGGARGGGGNGFGRNGKN